MKQIIIIPLALAGALLVSGCEAIIPGGAALVGAALPSVFSKGGEIAELRIGRITKYNDEALSKCLEGANMLQTKALLAFGNPEGDYAAAKLMLDDALAYRKKCQPALLIERAAEIIDKTPITPAAADPLAPG